MSDQMDALIKEINALAHKSKTEELSPEEKARQKEILDYQGGNDVTPVRRKKKVH